MNEYHKIKTVFQRDAENNYKTLLENQYAIPEFEYLKNNLWTWTEKVDGTNIRVMWNGTIITFGGKTNRAQIPSRLTNCLENLFIPLITNFKNLFPDTEACLYGEGYGAKIQTGGKYKSDGQDFVLFDIKIGHWWLQRSDIISIASQLGLDVVPSIGQGNLKEMVEQTRKGFKSQWGDFIAEGIVARPRVELKARNGDRIITKIKHRDF